MEPLPRSAPGSWRARGWTLFERLGVRGLLFFALGSSAVVPVALLGFDQAERWAASELAATDRQALGAAHGLTRVRHARPGRTVGCRDRSCLCDEPDGLLQFLRAA